MEGGGARLHGSQPEPLLDFGGGSCEVYNSGKPPPVDDNHLLQNYDIDDADKDDFIGGAGPAGRSFSQSGVPPAAASTFAPPYLNTGDRTYSQTSDLHNYQRYSDMDEFPEEEPSAGRYHSGVAASDDNIPGGGVQVVGAGHSRNRNSILSMGGGFMGKAKNMLGMGPDYSEMDLPLTEASVRDSRVDTLATDGVVGPREKKRFSPENYSFGMRRRKTDPSTLGPRIIQLNNSPANAANRWLANHVSTAKYNVVTFLPKFLYEQFSKYANLFFLFTAILQQIPNVSPTSRYTTVVPLMIVLLVSAAKELVEDFKRRNSDKSLNHSKARVLRGADFGEKKWIDVAVGDIVRIESEEPFPADLVLLASSEPEGLCYIETANLDGETNLKIKQAIPETAHLVSPGELGRLTGRVRSEQPNSSLYTYEATLTMQGGAGEKELPLTPDQLLLRGATLRNTPWIHGLVVFTGHETKLMRNATATPIKRTDVERMLNKQILMLVAILLILSSISTVGDLIVRATAGTKFVYLDYPSYNPASQFFLDILTYWVLYSNLVPISLFVTVELVKFYQAILINNDLDIYYAETDTPAICRTSSLVEELGQIEYIFSDKTGTLTCNVMQFRQCSIGGIQYAETVPEERRSVGDNDMNGIYDFNRLRANLVDHHSRSAIHHFLAMLATSHTVIPERKDEKTEIKYQAASPDEGALVEGAAMLGYKFVARKPRAVIIQVGGQEFEYELLAICEFNSTRKRMSTIFRCPDGKVRIYCKGADTVILERLAHDNPVVDVTLQHLEDYATDGLRTLCLAMREVPDQEFREWQVIFDKAATTVGGNRAAELDKAAEIIEHDLFLLGATAIEDKLQDGVPDTIHTLQTAGIKIWVLTGDRQETAINIGMSCKLISEDMTLLLVNEDNSTATRDNLTKKLNAVRNQNSTGTEVESLALIIDGKSLTFALEKDMEKTFLDLAISCKAVICCRVSPLQKALVVKLVKRHLKALLLAIGDGANDVSMIQAAHVGVGISGVEGLQAARSADVAIGQFRYLRKLLLVHGAWSYHRVSKVILYSFYKNIAMFMTQFWYSFQNAFSGQIIFESWTLTLYNVLFTVLPPFAMGIFDQFISARLLDRYPQLYQLGQKGTAFRMHSFFSWVGNGFYHSVLAYIFSSYFFYDDLVLSNGEIGGHWLWGTSLYTAVLAVVLGKAALVTNIWTKYTVLAIPGSMLVWLAFIPVYATVAPRIGSGFSTELRGIPAVMFTSPVFYAMFLLLAPLCLTRDFAWKYAKRMYYPQTYHHVQEIQKYNVQDYRPRMEQFQKAVRKVRQVQRMRKQRGYAFSAGDDGGQQMRVLNAYDTTRERGRYGEMPVKFHMKANGSSARKPKTTWCDSVRKRVEGRQGIWSSLFLPFPALPPLGPSRPRCLHVDILCSVAGPGYATNVHSAAPSPTFFAGPTNHEQQLRTDSCPPTRTCITPEMMLWKSRGGRPTTRNGGGRRHSVIEGSERPSESSAGQNGLLKHSEDSLALRGARSIGSLPFEEDQQSVDSPSASRERLEPQETTRSLEQADVPVLPNRNSRFSLMRFRHASDPQLSATFAAGNTASTPNLPTPTIITTSPTTQSFEGSAKQKSKRKLFGRAPASYPHGGRKDRKKHPLQEASTSSQNISLETPSADKNGQHVSFEEPQRLSVGQKGGAPPAYGDDVNSSLAIPVTRLSESSKSDGSSGDHGIYAQTTTTHTISTTTTFFRLPRRKKDKGPLFPLPARLTPSESNQSSAARTPRGSTSARPSMSPVRGQATGAVDSDPQAREQSSPLPSPTQSTLAFTNAPMGSPGPAIFRKESSMSQRSGASTPSLQVPPPRLGHRGRSSTLGSIGRSADHDVHESPPQLTPTERTSSSTVGRKSFGDIFSLSHRLRQNSEPPPRNGSGLPGTPGSGGSKAASFQISRELTYPQRGDEDTPATYLAKLEAAVPRGYMATILCKGSDEFSKTCLRKYMRGFSYFVDSIDMAIRKMLMEVELPKETQQIDRLLQGFADRYCECNPGIFVSVDEAYFIAFSILLLHSDTHNKNNKRKMQKQDYVKNTQDQVEVSNDVLECFYENVSYTPFIHFEDEIAVNSHRLAVPKSRKTLFRTPSTESLRGPVDPYTLILDNKLDVLRPPLKDVMDTEDTYNSLGTASRLDVTSVHNGFFRSGILQIVSARSRPDAFLTQATIRNPAEAQAGLVDIKAAKVGLLWRKDPKKKKTKSPWQEWGAILTSSQLYFFRDVGWIKRLMFQHESHKKLASNAGPVLFQPPLSNFEPDALISMDDAVALLDSSYKKHKHAFVFIKHGGFEEVFLANDEADMNDWIAKLNYAATFRTAAVRMKGHIGQVYAGPQRSPTQGNATNLDDKSAPQAETEPSSNGNDTRLLEQIIDYRRQIMEEKIAEATAKLALAQRELDSLLRNARHLQILTPIQAKTREALILAAGRMSAKLKWTRVEMARTKCHCDILSLDLDEGPSEVALAETSPLTPTPQKTSPLRSNRQSLTNSDSRTSEILVIPKSPVLAQKPDSDAPGATDKFKGSEGSSRPLSNGASRVSGHKSVNSLEVPASLHNNSANSSQEAIHLATSNPGSHSLIHQKSIVSSHRRPSDPDSRMTSPAQDLEEGEEQVLREAGLLSTDGTSPSGKRPETDGSDRDRVGSISSPDGLARDRGSVRRSLQRTLREAQHVPHLPHHHRSKKGRDSTSSAAITEDGKSGSGDSDGLARGTGSFILHGKKASVITFGSEWQTMSNEERLRLRTLAQKDDAKEEALIEDGSASAVSGPNAVAGDEKPGAVTGLSGPSLVADLRSPTNSTVTAATEEREEGEQSKQSEEVIEEEGGRADNFHSGFIPTSESRHSPQLQKLQA